MDDAAPNADTPMETRGVRLRQIAWLFLKLGTIAFGGPAAHIAMMEDEVVRRRRWITRERFLDLLGATNLIPGPNSTEMAIHVGYLRAGWPGLLLGGTCFILPAALVVSAIAWAYVRFGTLPQAEGVLYGIKPVIIAVVLQALWGLAKAAVKTRFLALVALGALAASLLGANELVVLFAGGLVVAIRDRAMTWRSGGLGALAPVPLLGSAAAATGAAFGLWPLFLVFVKIGAVLFGSGYVLLAFLRADLVERLHWLTEAQLLDAVAVGQFTPGPLFTTATFIGYVLGGARGAATATVGIFLPAFVFVALSGPFVPRMRRSKTAGALLDGVNVASLALMAAVTLSLARAAIVDVPTAALALAAAVLLVRFRINSAWLVLGGALAGLAAVYGPRFLR
ncbi:MAG: chromate efflux transporter [Myxococcales bacterium]